MTHYTFDFNNQTWGTAEMSWTGADGSPALGCMWTDGSTVPFDYVTSAITGISIPVDAGDALSFRVRIKGDPSGVSNTWSAQLVVSGGLVDGDCIKLADDFTFTDNDSGWTAVGGSVTVGGTITGAEMRIGDPTLSDWMTAAYFDTVYIDESPPTGPTDRRYLGITVDSQNLYLTSVRDNTLTLEYFAVATPGTILDTFTFGTADYTEPDTYTRAIYPIAVDDLEVYAYGRDGNNVQVQYNDLNGTAGWQDLGPGTATWSTSKYCAALMPSPFAVYTLFAAFADDDIYYNVDWLGSAEWTKQGDAGTVLRTAARVPTTFHQFLAAGQGTAQMYFTQNYGVSFDNAETGLAGTVNALEVSR